MHFVPNSPAVRAHANESLELDSAVRGGVLAAAGGILEANNRLRDNPAEQAAQLGGTGISTEDANALPANKLRTKSATAFMILCSYI